MISFKEFLTLNEEKDVQIDAIKKFCENDFDRILQAGGSGSGSENSIKKKINAEIKDPNKQFENFEDIKKLTKTIVSREKTKKANENDISESDTKIEDFYRIIYSNKNVIEKLSPYVVAKVRAVFEKTDKNNNKKIDKEEFKEAIKEIQSNNAINNNDAALVAYLMYIQSVGGSRFAITQQGALTSDVNLKPEKIFTDDENDKEIKEYFTDEKIKFLNSLFIKLKDFTFEPSILKNFKSYSNAKRIFNNKAELSNEGFTNKTSEDRAEEQLAADKKALEDVKREKKEAEDAVTKSQEEREKAEQEEPVNALTTKKRFYIFDVDMPSNVEEGKRFFEDMLDENKNLAMGMIKKVEDEFNSSAPPSKKGDLKVEESIIDKYINKSIIKESYESSAEKFRERIENVKNEIKTLTSKYQNKFQKVAVKIEASTSYLKDINLKKELKNIFIEYGYKVTNILQNFQVEAKRAKEKNFFYNIKHSKTIEQKGQEDKNVQIITKNIFGTDKNDDAFRIAKYMLVNILDKNNDSENVVRLLKQKDFKNMNVYLYVGDSNIIYALNSNSVEEKQNVVDGATVYYFNKQKTRIYKRPSELLMAAGININDLTVDVMKKIKQSGEYKGYVEDARLYINKANEVRNSIKDTTSSVFTEGIFNRMGKAQEVTKDDEVNNNLNSRIGSGEAKEISSICHKLNLGNEFQPKGNGPEDVAMRQIFKGFVFIVDKEGNNYVTTNEKLQEFIKNKEAANTDQTSVQQSKSKQSEEPKEKPEEKPEDESNNSTANLDYLSDKLKNANLSVVTSGAADSTYGDGYGYSKKANAIKKKLNCTTYTYSPNSKMKIVRRTFD